MKKQCSNCLSYEPEKKSWLSSRSAYCRKRATLRNHLDKNYDDVSVAADHCCWDFRPKQWVHPLSYC